MPRRGVKRGMVAVVDATVIVMAVSAWWGARPSYAGVGPNEPAAKAEAARGGDGPTSGNPDPGAAPFSSAAPSVAAIDEVPSRACLANTICAIKQRTRWRTSAWTPTFCERVADAVLTAAKREKLPPALIVAVMINESSLDPSATRITTKGKNVYAKDGGLMGLRCIVDQHDRCMNGQLRGMSWTQVLNPMTNIALGASALAYWRDFGGVMAAKTKVRLPSGASTTKVRIRRCSHADHAYWAHYNHGERYIDHGRARHYPHRIAVLYYALARTMNLDTATLTSMHLSVSDPGARPRTADRPVEARDIALCHSIAAVGPLCGEVMTAKNEAPSEPRSAIR